MKFLLRYLRDEDSFLDIGANVGVYTLLAASKVRSGWIYSFEALPKNYQRMQENLKLNENVGGIKESGSASIPI
ncbi:MAG: hypothetical protein BRC44_14965 [Cyanobacteria bacterium QS_4_48_99]|nr:MAG: hypothetical protein BRC44_14965 [Cyanobacteria bacterium QS_4_48_99]